MIQYQIKYLFWASYILAKVITIIGGGLLFYFMFLWLLWHRNYLGAISFIVLFAISGIVAHLICKLLPEDFGRIPPPNKPLQATR